MTSYLIFPSLAAAQTRSAQQASALGGDPTSTEYWWAQIEHPSSHQGALRIEDAGDFGAAGLATDEVAALVPAASMDPSWFPESA